MGEAAPKFLVTDESVRLARWLRLLGYDTATGSAQPLTECYRRAVEERRIVVTRNRRVHAGALVQVVQVASQALPEQLRQVIRELRVRPDEAHAFSRCDVCNVELIEVSKGQVRDQVPPYVFQTQQAFHACPSCRRVYWAATHCDRIKTQLRAIADA